MKLGVLGEPCLDFIHRPGIPAEKRLGGILYAVVSLAVMAGREHEIFPVMNLGVDEYDFVLGFIERFANINTHYIRKTAIHTRVVDLYYKDSTMRFESHESGKQKTYDREESSTRPTEPVDFELIAPLLPELDGLLINLVSGVDLKFETLKKIRNGFKGYVHMDLHNLVMQTHEDGTRIQVSVDNWLDWCMQCNTLQMNESEISVMPPEKMHEYETAEKILAGGNVKAVVVTRGKLGVSMYEGKQKNVYGEKYFELDKTELPSIESTHFVDSTGCGDVFSAAFFYKNCEHELGNLHASLNYANKMASANTTLFGVEELGSLV